MAETIHEEIKRRREETIPWHQEVKVYRDYAVGQQLVTLSSEMRRQVEGVDNHDFCENVCDKVIATVASRAELLGFEVGKVGEPATGGAEKKVAQFLDEFWIKNRMPATSYANNYATIRDGNHAIILGWKVTQNQLGRRKGTVTAHLAPFWDGNLGVWTAYGPDGTDAYAVRDFEIFDPVTKQTIQRRTIYYPDHFEDYANRSGEWMPFADGQTQSVTPWIKPSGEPIGIPVIHFKNGRSAKNPQYGLSDLYGGVLGLQDQINDIHWDITSAARNAGFQVYFVTGYQETEDGKPLYIGPGYVIKCVDPASKVGAIEAGDMSQLINTLAAKKKAVASTTRTPEHEISGGDWPSGLALVRADYPLVDKTDKFDKTAGPSYGTLAHRATSIANAYGAAALDEEILITPLWAAPERLDPTAKAEADKLKIDAMVAIASIEDEELMVKTGLVTKEEAARIVRNRDKRAQEMQAALIGEPTQDRPPGLAD